ncbi:MAG: peroxiredoxin-like family protein [Bacteroidota bacterium]
MKDVAIPSYREGLRELQENLSTMMPTEALDVFGADAEALQAKHRSVLKLVEGDKAPDFTLSNAVNESVNLYEMLKTSRVVLTFYRGSWCPYCNLALRQYQSIVPDIKALGGTLIAISPQTPDESLNIQEKNDLEFEVLSDNSNIIAKQFTTVHPNPEQSKVAMTQLGGDYDSYYSDEDSEIPVPATFIIERDGTISFARTEGGDYRHRVEPSKILTALRDNQTTFTTPKF